MTKTPYEIAQQQALKWTPADIKANYNPEGHFFDRATMRFFGDKMSSFGVFKWRGKRYLYRKPQAMIDVFGEWKRAGRGSAHVWQVVIDPDTLHCDLSGRGTLAHPAAGETWPH